MRQYKHRGCETVMYTYVGEGDGPLCSDGLRSRDWLLMGERIPFGSPVTGASCPDCHARISIKNTRDFVALDGNPFFGTGSGRTVRVIPTKPTLWQRIKEFFTKG